MLGTDSHIPCYRPLHFERRLILFLHHGLFWKCYVITVPSRLETSQDNCRCTCECGGNIKQKLVTVDTLICIYRERYMHIDMYIYRERIQTCNM